MRTSCADTRETKVDQAPGGNQMSAIQTGSECEEAPYRYCRRRHRGSNTRSRPAAARYSSGRLRAGAGVDRDRRGCGAVRQLNTRAGPPRSARPTHRCFHRTHRIDLSRLARRPPDCGLPRAQGHAYRNRFGAPYFGIHRADLQRILGGALGTAGLHLGHRLTNLVEQGDTIGLEFANGAPSRPTS